MADCDYNNSQNDNRTSKYIRVQYMLLVRKSVYFFVYLNSSQDKYEISFKDEYP